MQLWCSEACGRCCLRSRSSPPLPKTTVLGAAVGALGARKALTPAAHASATISRAMIAAEWARVAKCNRHQVGCVERLPPHPRARPSRRLLSDKIGSCAQCTSSHRPSVSLLEFKVPHGQLRPPRHYKTIRHFSRARIWTPGAIHEARLRLGSSRARLGAQGCLQAPRARTDQSCVRARLIAHSSLRKQQSGSVSHAAPAPPHSRSCSPHTTGLPKNTDS